MKLIFFILFQLEAASNKFLDYGIIGALLIIVGFFAYKMYLKINEDQEIWRQEAIKSRDAFQKISQEQNITNQRLIDIHNRNTENNDKNFKEISDKLDTLPNEIKKEIKLEVLSVRKTPAG